MFRFLPLVTFFCLISGVMASGPGKMPWLGVMIVRSDAGAENAKNLPEGVGLLVRKVTPSGPLDKVGGQAGDLWWKLEGQILVNMGQLVVLLKMHQPGDEVTLDFYRNGKLESQKVILGERPRELFIKRAQEMVKHRSKEVKKVEEVAEMTSGEYFYQLKDGQEGLYFKISQDDQVLFDAPVSTFSADDGMKREWKGALLILRQALATRNSKKQGDKKPRARRRYLPAEPQK